MVEVEHMLYHFTETKVKILTLMIDHVHVFK